MNQQNGFIWDVQQAGCPHNKTDRKGEVTIGKFLEEFEAFPWVEQLEKANQFSEDSAPTLTVSDLQTKKDFWISIAGDSMKHEFIIGYIYPREMETLFGFGKPKNIRWLEMYSLDDFNYIKQLIIFFFKREYSGLENSLKKLKSLGQIKSLDLTK